jgi:hypothetical protein
MLGRGSLMERAFHDGLPIMAADDLAGRPSTKLIFGMSPAASTNAAVNWRDYGRSRWQPAEKVTTMRALA